MSNPALSFKVDLEWSMSKLKARLLEQVEVLYSDISDNKMSNPQIAENYAKKLERVLALPCFSTKKIGSLSVETYKERLKTDVAIKKTEIELLDGQRMVATETDSVLDDILKNGIITFKRNDKIRLIKSAKKSKAETADAEDLMRRYYSKDIKCLDKLLSHYKRLVKQVKGYIEIVNSKDENLEIKNSWLVLNLKEAILRYIKSIEEYEKVEKDEKALKNYKKKRQSLEDFSNSSYFAKKADKQITVKELKDKLNRNLAVYEQTIALLRKLHEERSTRLSGEAEKSAIFPYKEAIRIIYLCYDNDLILLEEELEKAKKDYSLLRFFQALIEKDIFESLYV